MINDDKTFYHKALVWSAFLFLVIKPLVTVYLRYAIFFRPISPSTEIPELQAGINYYRIIGTFYFYSVTNNFHKIF